MEKTCKLRIKYPSGMEFEAEGSLDFVTAEKQHFITAAQNAPVEKQTAAGPAGAEMEQIDTAPIHEIWQKTAIIRQDLVVLTAKSPNISQKEAALIIIAARQMLGFMPEYPAVKLSKSMKMSGYQPGRLDRILNQYIKNGKITASGTKRNRTYKTTPKGMAAAFMLAKAQQTPN